MPEHEVIEKLYLESLKWFDNLLPIQKIAAHKFFKDAEEGK